MTDKAESSLRSKCPGCGAVLPLMEGPVHAYMHASPACWAAYGEVLAREYEDPALFAASHRLTVDAYALQHPGEPSDRRARQSVWLHFMSLHLIFASGWPPHRATAELGRLAGRDFPPPPDPPGAFPVTAADVAAAGREGHVAAVAAWARAAYTAWGHLVPDAETYCR